MSITASLTAEAKGYTMTLGHLEKSKTSTRPHWATMARRYDVIIVGGGPAGIFAALELSKASNLNILLVEKGEDIDKRSNLVCGLGGAGAFSDWRGP